MISKSEWLKNEIRIDRHTVDVIISIIAKYTEINEAIIFGSRADGTNKEASDIDIAIKCKSNNFDKIGSILNDFVESNLPFFVDIIDYNSISSEKLKLHIDTFGVVFFEKY